MSDNSIVPSTVLDFVGQVSAFYTYVLNNTGIAWNSSNALVAINFGSMHPVILPLPPKCSRAL